jgi:phytoene dehydrogenase-like protein
VRIVHFDNTDCGTLVGANTKQVTLETVAGSGDNRRLRIGFESRTALRRLSCVPDGWSPMATQRATRCGAYTTTAKAEAVYGIGSKERSAGLVHEESLKPAEPNLRAQDGGVRPVAKAVVVGSGPNGLAAALAFARAGLDVTVLEAHDEIGGGTRSGESLGPGLVVDHCAAFHPLAVASPALAGLEHYGLRWAWPEIDCAHPLDQGPAGLLHRSVETTGNGLGADGRKWRLLFEGPSKRYADVAPDLLGPVVHLPRRPFLLARFGAPAVLPATTLGRLFSTEQARALLAGVAAHAMRPLTEPFSSAIGIGIITAGHRNGWPVVVGGTHSIAHSLQAALLDLGGRIETGVRVTTARQLPRAAVTVFDLAPGAVADILADRLPSRSQRAYRRFRHGPATFKVDFAVEGSVPWSDPDVARAGTVHLGGSADEVTFVESEVTRGRMPERPFVLVGQQYVADPSRSRGSTNPLYAYAHVPAGYIGDATEVITAQIERFAPGFRDCILAVVATGPAELAAGNANFVSGDILTGANSPRQLLLGPRPGQDPYRTGLPGHYLCSAATPPGPGAHGMAGMHAARRALKDLRWA